MPVNTTSNSYKNMLPKWERCRDAYEGSDAVKKAGEIYLPKLDSHKDGKAGYEDYKTRALYFNATARTVDGLAGGVFQKQMKTNAPERVRDHLEDINLAGEAVDLFALHALREVLLVGRRGVLVDMSNNNDGEPNRPYWAGYKAEDIVAFRTQSLGGDQVLTRVVLRETVEEQDATDTFALEEIQQHRVLELADGAYLQSVWRKKSPDSDEWVPFIPANQEGPIVTPLRLGKPLSRIPFTFLGPTSNSPRITKPTLLDLVDTNLSHYRTMADLEHGRHFTALPQPWISGHSDNDDSSLYIGSNEAWMLDPGASAGMLEFTGQGLSALEKADQQKRLMMATQGARLLEDQPSSRQGETATAVAMRHAGEQATLRTVAGSVETGLTKALRWHAWWAGTEDTPRATNARISLNKDFSIRMEPEELRALVEALQGNAISYDTFWTLLGRGDLARPGVSAEEELEAIRSAAPSQPAA